MKKKIITFLFICLVSFTFVSGQCKISSINGGKWQRNEIKAKEKLYPVEIEACTQYGISLLTNWSIKFSIFFFINEKGEYLIGGEYNKGSYESKFEILEKNSLVFVLNDGTEIAVFPPVDIKWKQGIRPYYKISKEQIEKLATIDVKGVKLYVVSEKEIKRTFEDKQGSHFYIDTEKMSEKILEDANCILSYKKHE